jgi:nucleoside-diphosphate-sugar epimerase
MRVMVTGGTGFVGAHSARALVDAGHQVRLLVRSPDKIDEVLKPMGVEPDGYVVGDMTDAGAVGEALDGCDAVLHCAAVVALDRRRADSVLATNLQGADVVLGAAVERGADPIVYVSSVSALFKPGLELIHADLPPTDWGTGYGRSKAAAEGVARRHQEAGAPVVITYPGTVTGPAAGSLVGEIGDVIATHLRVGLMPVREAAWSVVDVRDLGLVHAKAMRPGQGPRRYMCGGTFVTMEDQARIYRSLTGRRFPMVAAPPAVLRGFGALMDAAMRVVPFESLMTAEGMAILTGWAPTDDGPVHEELGIAYRDVVETFGDALRSLLALGRIGPRQAGRLARS